MNKIKTTERSALKPGAFYWVRPLFDVDFIPPGFEGKEWSDAQHDAAWAHWVHNEQPARFNGVDELGVEQWQFIGVDDAAWWPVIWIGSEIVLCPE